LVNIIERLKIYFGKQGNLSIESITGKGTTVTISIPVCNTPPEIRREVDENADNNYC
jgi:LytS/YehU family sensor histidine kinase